MDPNHRTGFMGVCLFVLILVFLTKGFRIWVYWFSYISLFHTSYSGRNHEGRPCICYVLFINRGICSLSFELFNSCLAKYFLYLKISIPTNLRDFSTFSRVTFDSFLRACSLIIFGYRAVGMVIPRMFNQTKVALVLLTTL